MKANVPGLSYGKVLINTDMAAAVPIPSILAATGRSAVHSSVPAALASATATPTVAIGTFALQKEAGTACAQRTHSEPVPARPDTCTQVLNKRTPRALSEQTDVGQWHSATSCIWSFSLHDCRAACTTARVYRTTGLCLCLQGSNQRAPQDFHTNPRRSNSSRQFIVNNQMTEPPTHSTWALISVSHSLSLSRAHSCSTGPDRLPQRLRSQP